MGTVIINGQTYDAITGLPVNSKGSDFADCGTNKTLQSESDAKARIDAERRAILGDVVSNTNDTAAPVTPRGIKHEVEAAAKTVVERARNSVAPDWINNYIQGGAPREIQPVTEQERDFRAMLRNRQPISVKRQPGVSQTLNRRYVRKPSSEAQDKVYTPSIAIDQYHKSKAMRKMFDSKVPDVPVKPVLTRRQSAAVQLHNARSAVTTAATVAAAQSIAMAAEQSQSHQLQNQPVRQSQSQSAQQPQWSQQRVASTVSQQTVMKVAAMRAAALAAERNARLAEAQRAELLRAARNKANNNVVKTAGVARANNASNVAHSNNTSAADVAPNRVAKVNTGRSLSGMQRVPYPRPIQKAVVPEQSVGHMVSSHQLEGAHSVEDAVDKVSDRLTAALIHADELRNSQPRNVETEHHDNNTAPLLKVAQREAEHTEEQVAKRGHRKFKLSAIASAVTAVALLLGYGGYLAYPNVQLRIAASKAGLDAKDFYAPSGYKVSGSVAMGEGKLAVNYRGENNASYRINQERSKATDADVKNEATIKGKDSFDSLKAGDVNVYRYNDKASWVKNGVRYTLDTNDFLTSDQIVKIASSVK